MWCVGTRFSVGLGSSKLMAELHVLGGLFQDLWVYDSNHLFSRLPRKGRRDARGENRWSEEVTVKLCHYNITTVKVSLHFPSSVDTHFPKTEVVLCSEVPQYHCGVGCAGHQGCNGMAGGSSTPDDATEEILSQGTIAGKGHRWHLQFNRGDLHNFRCIKASLVETTQHIFL